MFLDHVFLPREKALPALAAEQRPEGLLSSNHRRHEYATDDLCCFNEVLLAGAAISVDELADPSRLLGSLEQAYVAEQNASEEAFVLGFQYDGSGANMCRSGAGASRRDRRGLCLATGTETRADYGS
jgi:hypothetical protein